MNAAGENFVNLIKVIEVFIWLTSSFSFYSPLNSVNSDVLPFVAAIVCQVEALQREVCVRNTHWQQQRQREEDILSDLDSTLFQCLFRVAEANSYQVSRGELSVLVLNILYSLASE